MVTLRPHEQRLGDGDLYRAWGDGGGSAGTIMWGVSVRDSRRLPGCPARWTLCPTAAKTYGDCHPTLKCPRTSVARSAAWWPSTPSSTRWEAFGRRTTARIPFAPADVGPKQHCLVGGFHEILTNCGHGCTTRREHDRERRWSILAHLTSPAAGTLMYMTATSARLVPTTCDSATICRF
jgi:hypothetical protein